MTGGVIFVRRTFGCGVGPEVFGEKMESCFRASC